MKDIYSTHPPLFSIVVPAYNSADFIDKCIESVLTQTCSDFELILVDDGSTDSTLEVCNAYAQKDRRVKVLHKENGGHTSARNEGLIASAGEYILFLDSDDWIAADVLEICTAEIETNKPDVMICNIYNTGTKRLFEINVAVGFYHMSAPDNSITDALIMDEDGRSAFVKGLIGKVFRKEIIIKNQLNVPKEIQIGEDAAAFVGAMIDASSVSVVPNATYYYCVRKDSLSHSADDKAFCRLPFMFAYYKQKLKDASEDICWQFDRYIVAQLYTAALLVMRSGGGRKELTGELARVLQDPCVSNALNRAKFSYEGYKYIVKRFILRHRLWWLARLLDR